MKKFLNSKKVIISIMVLVVIILVTGILLFAKNNNKSDNENKILKETTYTMYVKINPLVKLIFRETEYKCHDTAEICSSVDGIVDYELLNDDGKEIYSNIDFKGKGIYEAVGILCDVARENNIAFKNIDITTNYKFNYEYFKNEMEKNSKYEIDYEITLNIKEVLNEKEIIDSENNVETKKYNVYFDSNGGNEVENQIVDENSLVSVPISPTRKGYKFVEWQLNGVKYDFNSEIKEDITLKAKWEKENTATSNNTPNGKENSNNDNSNTPNKIDDITKLNIENDNSNTQTETKRKSTPDNINLNDNILVPDPEYECDYEGSYQGGTYAFPNIESLQNAKNQMISYLKSQKGIINININDDINNFRFSYHRLYLSEYNADSISNFVNAYNKKYEGIRDKVLKIFYDNGGNYVEHGAMGGGCMYVEPVLLDETLCNRYNLTCNRW